MDGGGGADEAGGAVLVGADVLMMNYVAVPTLKRLMICCSRCQIGISRGIQVALVLYFIKVIEIFHLWKETRGRRVEKSRPKYEEFKPGWQGVWYNGVGGSHLGARLLGVVATIRVRVATVRGVRRIARGLQYLCGINLT